MITIACEICKTVIYEVSCYLYDHTEYHTEAVCIACYDNKRATDKLLEDIADFMHDQWSHWMKYMFSQGGHTGEPRDRFYEWCVRNPTIKRWERQMNTPYAELSEKEKDSDREWAKKLLELIN